MVQAETDADEILDPAAALAALRDCSVVIGMVAHTRTRAHAHTHQPLRDCSVVICMITRALTHTHMRPPPRALESAWRTCAPAPKSRSIGWPFKEFC